MKKIIARPILLSALISICQPFALVHATTLCEMGRITYLAHAAGGESLIHISTTPGANTPATLKRTTPDKTVATEIWHKESSIRWNDRVSLLKMAYALQVQVLITSSDNNCMGPADEFRITLIN